MKKYFALMACLASLVASGFCQQGIVETTGDLIARQPFDLKTAKLKIPAPDTQGLKQQSESTYRIDLAISPRTVFVIIDGTTFNAIKRNPNLPIYCGIKTITDDSVELVFAGNEWVGPGIYPKWKQSTSNQ